ncbi:MAG: PilN domain-containing protein [Deltaproteobacteria bacterium]|uniref:PilN domain-containing protein n=1 Tax=Candidatus Zymogenus saltonus TaxID=2844893 RepID=A0A9D8KGV4_9DELT|nr:PilN domain-containing protein [Candidatus Zymogenus saltonus]
MIKINLLETREVKKKETLRQQVVIAVLALIATLGIIGYFHLGITKKIEETIEKKEKLDNDIKTLQKEAEALKKFKKQVSDLESRRNVIRNLQSERNGPVMVMDEIADVMPRELWIDDFQLKGSKLTIKGYTADNETLATFMRNLDSSNYFKGITLTQSKKSQKEGLTVNTFALSMGVMYPKMEGEEEKVAEKPAEKKKPAKKKPAKKKKK